MSELVLGVSRCDRLSVSETGVVTGVVTEPLVNDQWVQKKDKDFILL